MHCHQIIEWGQPLEARDYPTPKPQGTEVLLRIQAAGVCHSDVHIRAGYFDLGDGEKSILAERGATLPLTLGHETVGEVMAMGPDAAAEAGDLKLGDSRVVFPWIGCRSCDWCAAGTEYLCDSPKFIGARVDGGYADEVVVPHPKYLIEYGDVPTDLACTYACSGITAYSALSKIGSPGEKDAIVIIGAGGVGLNAVHIARAMYDGPVIVADIDANKRQAAEGAGATMTIDNSDESAVQAIIEATKGGAAATLDFVGAPATSQFGINVVKKAGTHVVIGLYGGKLGIPLPAMSSRQMNLRGSYVGTLEEMHALMELVHAGKVPPIPTTPRPLDEANAAVDDLEAGRVVGRYVLKP
jgi:D-arabinose 1-dehydrogenase-like Zn-dependent alcohol dehydrogenase